MSYHPPRQPPAAGQRIYLDQTSRRRYWVDESTNEQVFEDGERVPRTLPNAAAPPQQHRWHPQARGQNYHTLSQTLTPVAQPAQPAWPAPTVSAVPPPLPPPPSTHVSQYPIINAPSSSSYPSAQSSRPVSAYPLRATALGHPGYPARLTALPNTDPLQGALASQLRHISIGDVRQTSENQGVPYSGASRQGAPNAQTRILHENGMQVEDRYDALNGVHTRIGRDPPPEFRDQFLRLYDFPVNTMLLENGGNQERLFPNYCIKPSEFFVFGRVFMVLWAEPAGATTSLVTDLQPGESIGPYGEKVYSKARRFVVVRQSTRFCTALPIMSYGLRGVGKPGVVKGEHVIVYTGNTPPQPIRGEAPRRGEAPMRPNAIRVVPDNEADQLHPMSRLDLGKPHTVEFNLKVAGMGMVHQRSLVELETQFRNVVLGRVPSAGRAATRRSTGQAMPSGSVQAAMPRQTPAVVSQPTLQQVRYRYMQGLIQQQGDLRNEADEDEDDEDDEDDDEDEDEDNEVGEKEEES